MEEKLDGKFTRLLQAILNKSWSQHPTKQQVNGHPPTITKTIHVRRTRHAGHCWKSRDELISDILLLTPSHVRASVGRRARTYTQQLCADTGCSLKDLPGVMDDRMGGGKESGRSVLTARHDDDISHSPPPIKNGIFTFLINILSIRYRSSSRKGKIMSFYSYIPLMLWLKNMCYSKRNEFSYVLH